MDLKALEAEVKNLNRKYRYMNTPIKPVPGKGKGRLSGVVVSVKDCICVKGVQSAAGSRILEGYEPTFNATVVENALGEGATLIGKTNQDEFGFGTFSANSGYQVPRNPHDPERSCGGSSGGAAGLTAALPEKFRHIAIGQSTGGSISCPASFCGVIGITPTYGLVSRYGLIDYANSLDKIGPIARTVADAALMLSIMAGHDPRDQTSLDRKPEEYARNVDMPVKGLKIGVPREYFGDGLDPEVEGRVWEAIKSLESHGATYEEISLPTTSVGISAYYIIATAEASTNLARYCGMRYGASQPIGEDGKHFNEYFSEVRGKYLGKEAKRRILLGTYARMAGYRDAFYLKAMKARTLIINDFKKAFKKHDVLAAPTMPVVAPKLSEVEKMGPVEQYMMDVLTVAPNLAGIPMASIPCGKSKGMPVGLHLMADHLKEANIIKAGSALGA